jgi:hypothetical protein
MSYDQPPDDMARQEYGLMVRGEQERIVMTGVHQLPHPLTSDRHVTGHPPFSSHSSRTKVGAWVGTQPPSSQPTHDPPH